MKTRTATTCPSTRRTALQDPRRAPLRRAPLSPPLPGKRFRSVEPVELVLDENPERVPTDLERGPDGRVVDPSYHRLPPRAPGLPRHKTTLRRLSTTRRRLAANMARLDDLEIFGWWDSETSGFGEFVLKLLASMPGGDEAEDMGYEGYDFMGWKEFDLIGKMMEAIETKDDVAYIVHKLTAAEEEEEEEEGGEDPGKQLQ